ncbi:hypothetical protein [Ruminococcus albus]|uniref:Lipoprotein n=1 Tax=Ruminococcus albus TaxID=1264 RepID=A0A1I1R8U3_RUMAL|nr:hypothetical protein [Ruminococcus albus]SFD28578.1 hypothetical protein SAMN02910406_03578 [Ruminococcus albus]
MKRIAVLILAALMLTSCGDTSKVDKLIEEQKTTGSGEVTLSPADEAIVEEAEKAVSEEQDKLTDTVTTTQPPMYIAPDESKLKNGDIDLDLTTLNPNLQYAEAVQISCEREEYKGKKIRIQGTFDYAFENGKEYFAVYIGDAAACCMAPFEFRTSEKLSYPDDYPKIGSTAIITGTYN